MLGRLLQVAAQQERHDPSITWEQLVREDIFEPLHMAASTLRPPDNVTNLARGYSSDGAAPLPLLDMGWAAPAGAAFSTVNDLAKLMQFLLQSPPLDRASWQRPQRECFGTQEPLSRVDVRAWLSGRVWTDPVELGPGQVAIAEWGAPWEVYRANAPSAPGFQNFDLVTKNGDIPGYSALLMLQPDLQLGIMSVMSTGDGSAHAFQERLREGFAQQFIPAFVSALRPIALPDVAAPPSPTDYIGSYIGTGLLQGMEQATVRWDAEASVLLLDSQLLDTGRLAFIHGDVFQQAAAANATCGDLEHGDLYTVQFVRDTTGLVTGMTYQGIGIYPATATRS